MIALKGPSLSSDERKRLTPIKSNLESVIAEVEGDFQKVKDLRQKEEKYRKETPRLQSQAAAALHPDAEAKLSANQQVLLRISDSIREAEAQCHVDKYALFQVTDAAQELISKICQETYNELLDQIGTSLCPYYRSFDDARYVARGTNATNDLVINLLTHRTHAADSIERLFEAAQDTLRKVNALLKGGVIWTFKSDDVKKSAAAA